MNLEIFKNEEFGEVRTATVNNKPYVCLSDVCKILEIKNVSQCKERLNQKGICITDTLTAGGKQQMIFINESNLYKVIFQSRKSEAEKFTDWVTNDVLPSIRKHGMYATDELLDNPDFAIKILEQLKLEREEKNRLQVACNEMKPKALFAEGVETAHTSILVGDMAKILKQNGVDTGQNRFFEYLRQNGYLCNKKGDMYNIPTQKSMNMGLFEVKERTINEPNGAVRITKTPKITGKGQVYFINKFIGSEV